MKKEFTQKDFTIIVTKPLLKKGQEVIVNGLSGKILEVECPKNGPDYVLFESDVPYKGCTIHSIRKWSFNYITYPE